jgi:hypothetical protein
VINHVPVHVDIFPLLISILNHNIMLLWVLDISLKLSFPLFEHRSGRSTFSPLITCFRLGDCVLIQVLVRNGFIYEACGFAFAESAVKLADCQENSLKVFLR